MVNKSKTAAELMLELKNDPFYNKRIAEKANDLQDTELINKEESIISDLLSEVNIEVNSIYDLVNSNKPYPNAIPVLVNIIENRILSSHRVLEGVIRALGVKEAIGIANQALINFYNFNKNRDVPYKWAIGNTMSIIVKNDDLYNIIEIVENKANGNSRQMFILSLGNIPLEESEIALIKALDDEEVASFAIEALGKLKSKLAKNKLKQMTTHTNALVRKMAKKALTRIG